MRATLVTALALTAIVPVQATLASHSRSTISTEWPTYLGGGSRAGYAGAETLINPDTVSTLKVRWREKTGGAVSDEPIVARGIVYWGSWDGVEHATTIYGRSIWARHVGRATTMPECTPSHVGIAGSAAFSVEAVNRVPTPVIFVPGGDAQVYALNAVTGSMIWHTRVGKFGNAFLWDSPLVYGGHVYIGISSFGDCPLVQGKLVELDVSTGRMIHEFDAVPAGCTGAGIWGTPTLDVKHGAIYDVTGNDGQCGGAEPLSQSIVELRVSDLSLIDSWAVPESQRGIDSDFGSTATLFSSVRNGASVTMVGAVNKNGVYYAFRAGDIGAGPAWEKRIGLGGEAPQNGSADIAPSAWDGNMLYIAGGITSIPGQTCRGSLRAIHRMPGARCGRDA